MEETRLFRRLEADYLPVTKQLEGHKKDKERISIFICCNGDGSYKIPLWVVDSILKNKCHFYLLQWRWL